MKKKNYKIWVVFAILLVVAVGIGLFVKFGNKSKELSLAKFKNAENEYQYEDISWGLSPEDVRKKLPYKIEKDTEVDPLPENTAYYKMKERVQVDGQAATMSLEFYDDKLSIVKFDFHLDENYQKWFDKQVKELKKLYGEESEKIENSSEELKSAGYKWETDHTRLQISIITGSGITPSGTIAVGLVES